MDEHDYIASEAYTAGAILQTTSGYEMGTGRMKKYVVIDFDDVIADSFPHALKHLNKRQPVRIKDWSPVDFTRWDVSRVTGLGEETVHEAFQAVDYDYVYQVPNSTTSIRHLVNQGVSVQVVTANPREEDIRRWLDGYGLSDVPLTSTPDKISFMEKRGFNAIVDDNPDTLVKASAKGYLAIRYLRPWNEEMLSARKSNNDWGTKSNEVTALGWYDVVNIIRPWDESSDQQAWRQMERDLYEEMLEWNDATIDVVTNKNGAKQTDIRARYDLLPSLAMEEVARILKQGAEKYGEENWRGLGVNECHNHTVGHAINFNQSQSLEDLAHTACRALMTLELYLVEKKAHEENSHTGFHSCNDPGNCPGGFSLGE